MYHCSIMVKLWRKHWRKHWYKLAFLVIILLIICTLYSRNTPRPKARFPMGRPAEGTSSYITVFPWSLHGSVNHSKQTTVKTILLWTGFFGDMRWGTDSSTFQSCAVTACRTTVDKGELDEADAVMMNIRGISSRSDLPPYHQTHQVWILHSSEPPYYSYIDADDFNNVFNWTSWYRSDADIYASYDFYNDLQDITPNKDEPHEEPASGTAAWFRPHSPAFRGLNLSYIQQDYRNLETSALGGDAIPDMFSLHDRLVYWTASSCVNQNQRYKMVAKLKKLVPLDTYGNCGSLPCAKNTDACDAIRRRYKFVLAFENGNCRDYITEKYWDALSRFQIPVVMGGADYSKQGIPQSYIDVDNFSSAEDLARFLLRVGNNRDLYNSYHTWRARYQRAARLPYTSWCQICQALHDANKLAQVYTDLEGWMSEDSCPLSNVFDATVWTLSYFFFTVFGI